MSVFLKSPEAQPGPDGIYARYNKEEGGDCEEVLLTAEEEDLYRQLHDGQGQIFANIVVKFAQAGWHIGARSRT